MRRLPGAFTFVMTLGFALGFGLGSAWASAGSSDTLDRLALMGQKPAKVHEDLVPVASPYLMPGLAGAFLQKDTYEAARKMMEAAWMDGVPLRIRSAYRSWHDQKGIWERKWQKERQQHASDLATALSILRFSAAPGASRHHWGTDIDFNATQPAYFQSGEGRRILEWLEQRGAEFGFCRVYSDHAHRRGHQPEAWHWSYMPVSRQRWSAHTAQVEDHHLAGFSGASSLVQAGVISQYVHGLDAACHAQSRE